MNNYIDRIAVGVVSCALAWAPFLFANGGFV